ncbi:unnamed protein product [Urochloa humidicola]
MEPEGAVILKPPVTMIKGDNERTMRTGLTAKLITGLYVELGMEIPEQVFRNLLKTQAIVSTYYLLFVLPNLEALRVPISATYVIALSNMLLITFVVSACRLIISCWLGID